MSTEPLALTRLRAVERADRADFPFEALVVLMAARTPRPDIEAFLARSTTEILDAVVELGTWLGIALGAAPTQPLPPGFTRTACGRDIRRAVSNVVFHAPGAERLVEFRAQRTARRRPRFGVELAAALVTLASTSGLERIDELAARPDGTLDPDLAAAVVDAFDRIEGARRVAVDAVDRLASLHPSIGPADVLACCDVASWLHEAEFTRIRRATELSALMLYRQLRQVRALAEADPRTWRPRSLAELRYGQVLRLWERFGPLPEAVPA